MHRSRPNSTRSLRVRTTSQTGFRYEPTRKRQLLDAIAETNGDAIAITEEAVQAELDRLHANGFYVEPTSAIAPAALTEYRERGTLGQDTDVVMPLTGHGLKT